MASYPGSHFRAHGQQNPNRFQTPVHHSQFANGNLNPSMPPFQPIGSEVQRYQGATGLTAPPTPPSSNSATAGSMIQLQNLMLDHHFAETRVSVRLQRQADQNTEDIRVTQETVRSDMRSLEDQLRDLREQIISCQQQGGAIARVPRADQDLTPTDEMLDNFSKQTIAGVYLDEAEDYEKAASNLRVQADELCGGATTSRKLSALRLLPAPNGVGPSETKAEFSCCGETYSSIQEMLEHVHSAHSFHPHLGQDHRPVTINGVGDETPTHVPAHRAKPENAAKQSHAIQIKAPEQDDQTTPTQSTVNPHEQQERADATVNGLARTRVTIPESLLLSNNSTAVSSWQPLAVRNMPGPVSVDSINGETFTFEFLKRNLGGSEWSYGFYFVPEEANILPSKSYWILNEDTEPYLPSSPGDHGAKITAFFNDTISGPDEAPDESNYQKTPVFIRQEGSEEYTYFGNYSQLRFSDKLDADRLADNVPEHVREYWASTLADKANRPDWVTHCLMQHFWPKPTYFGPIPSDMDSTTVTGGTAEAKEKHHKLDKRIDRALWKFADELRECEKEASMKVSLLTKDVLLDSFKNADADEVPGLRLWWEYLQCVGYDQNFYEFLVKMKYNPKLQSPPKDVGGKTAKGKGNVETVHPAPAPASMKKEDAPAPTHREKKTPSVAPPNAAATANITKSTKNHTGMNKPWEKAAEKPKAEVKEEAPTTNSAPVGDIEAAKRDAAQFTRAKGRGGTGKAAYVPPHQRK